jgi:hypothetical protein|tara:strand:+ start:1775 stop:1987 length:213 start_codon:yes stop_codon:yes gene_type:complete
MTKQNDLPVTWDLLSPNFASKEIQQLEDWSSFPSPTKHQGPLLSKSQMGCYRKEPGYTPAIKRLKKGVQV